MNKQQSFHNVRQIDVCNSELNPLVPLMDLQVKKSPEYSVITSDELIKLEITNKIVVLASLFHNLKKAQKLLYAKVHSLKQLKDENPALKSKEENNNNEPLQIFSVNDEEKNIKQRCVEVSIKDSRVNIYALRKLVKILSRQLINLKLHNCTFYESDKQTFKGKIPSSNNKMLRELTFAFQIKAIQLPEIESIDIILQSTVLNEDNLYNRRRQLVQKKNSIQEKKNKLVKKYQCSQNSQFIDFEMNLKKQLEEKYNKYNSEGELVFYIKTGNLLGKNDEVEKKINQNIINDIEEHTRAFTRYIKESLINKEIFIIKGSCLEDPIAFSMVQSIIFKNKKNVKTIIFKGTGTIPYQCFLRIIDLLVQIKLLESIAFFDSQPEFDSKSYALFKEIQEIKSFKFIVLNRSTFNIAEYQYQAFGKKGSISQDFKQEKLTRVITPKYYAFYLINRSSILEFTPYKFIMRDLLGLNKSQEKEQQSKEEASAYEVGKLIKQQEEYDCQVKNELKKYENQSILKYQAGYEKILVKYQSIDLENKYIRQSEISQGELENDIKMLIKHPSIYTIPKANQLIKVVIDSILNDSLQKQCSYFRDFQSSKILSNKEQLQNIILQQTSLVVCSGIQDNNTVLTSRYPIKCFREQTNISENVIDCKDIENINLVEVISFPLNQQINAIHVEFEKTNFSIYITSNRDAIEEIRKYKIIHNLNHQDLFQLFNNKFHLKISQFLEAFKNQKFDLSFGIYLPTVQKENADETHIEEKKEINELCYLFVIVVTVLNQQIVDPIRKIKYLQLNSVSIKSDMFVETFDCETISFKDCEIESFDIMKFQLLRCLTIQDCKFLEDEFLENIIKLKLMEESSSFQEEAFLDQQISDKDQFIFKIGWSSNTIPIYYKPISFRDYMSSLLLNQSRVILFLYEQNGSIISSIQQIGNLYPKHLNQTLFNQFYHSGIIIQQNNNIDLKNDFINNKSSIINNQQEPQKNESQKSQQTGQQQNQKNDISNACVLQKQQFSYQNLKDLYLTNPQLDNYVNENYQKTKSVFFNISECCKNNNEKDEKQIEESCFSGLSFHQHLWSNDFCIPKTSIFQNPFQLRKVEIKFFKNLLINKPLIYDYEEMKSIEELSFCCDTLYYIEQIEFTNYLIKSSSHLKVFKWKINSLKISTAQDTQITFAQFHQNCFLQKVSIKSSDKLGSLIESILQSNLSQLVSLKLLLPCSDSQIKQFLEKSKANLNELSIRNIHEYIQKCVKLERIYLEHMSTLDFDDVNSFIILNIFQFNKEIYSFFKISKFDYFFLLQ